MLARNAIVIEFLLLSFLCVPTSRVCDHHSTEKISVGAFDDRCISVKTAESSSVFRLLYTNSIIATVTS